MKLIRILFLVSIIGLFPYSLSAQALATGETGGKGGRAILVSANGITPEGLELYNFYGQYIYGLTDWLDLGPVYGNISALGQAQHYLGFGWNARLLKRNQVFFDVSFFGVVTTPLNQRSNSSVILTAPALIISRPVTIGESSISLYSGFNTNIPLGNVQDKLFTPPDLIWNVPIGFSRAVSERWLLFAEVDVHSRIEALGLGLVKIF